ncbi:MAG: DNA-binding domain-containing protein [Rhizobiaceae bacterium]
MQSSDQTPHKNFGQAIFDPNLDIPEGIIGPDGQAAPVRFGVYRNNVIVSLIEAMKDAYPSILSILEEENFSRVARNYVAAHPPKSPMMQEFGNKFAQFLREFEPLKSSLFLVDLASAERAWLVAYHAEDQLVVAPEELGAVPPEIVMDVTFEKHAASWISASQFPLFALYCRRDDASTDIDLTQSQNVLITRPQNDVIVRHVGAGNCRFFEQIFAGSTLGEAIGAGTEIDDEFDPANAITILLESGSCSKLEQPKA